MNMMRNGQVIGILKVEPGGLVDVLDMRFEPKRETKANSKLFGLCPREISIFIPLTRWEKLQ